METAPGLGLDDGIPKPAGGKENLRPATPARSSRATERWVQHGVKLPGPSAASAAIVDFNPHLEEEWTPPFDAQLSESDQARDNEDLRHETLPRPSSRMLNSLAQHGPTAAVVDTDFRWAGEGTPAFDAQISEILRRPTYSEYQERKL
jgi:hypothetical protein